MARYHHLMERLRSIFSIQLPADEDTLEVKSRLADIAILNSIDITTDLASFQFLPTPAATSSGSSDSRPFASRLSILLTWAITLGQAGDPTVRPYIATALILAWKAQALRTIPNVNQFLQRQLLSWLEEKDLLRPYMHQSSMVPPSKVLFWRRGANATGEMEAIALLFGDLVHRKLFSFSDYLTRMTSFGQGSAPSPTKTDSSMDSVSPKTTAIPPPDHLELLRHLPLWDRISEQLLNQRKIVLYGIRARKTVEDAMEKEIRAEIRRVVPLFFNGRVFHSDYFTF
jgi:mediator of RNA polymerase II transcription subunit 12, fungi type